jgi:hypothetical protein
MLLSEEVEVDMLSEESDAEVVTLLRGEGNAEYT